MWKRATGEPYAGEPPVRFGGREAQAFPTPIFTERSCIASETRHYVARQQLTLVNVTTETVVLFTARRVSLVHLGRERGGSLARRLQ